MPTLHVLTGFNDLADPDLQAAAEAVLEGLYSADYWTGLGKTPPVTHDALQTAFDNFSTAIGLAKIGGTAATSDKNDKGEVLATLLYSLADFVENNCANNPTNVLSAGFKVVSTNRTQSPLPMPIIRDFRPANPGQAIIRAATLDNVKSWVVHYRKANPDGTFGPTEATDPQSNSQRLLVENLTSGAEYGFQIQAYGGSTGKSPWSEELRHRVG